MLVRAALVAFVLGLTATAHADPSIASCRGRVVDARSGEALAGAVLRVRGVTVGVDETGRFDVLVPPGRHRLTVRLDGYAPLAVTCAVRGGQTAHLEIALERASSASPYETVVRSVAPRPAASGRSVEPTELATVPGTGGDPLRTVEAMPGAVPIATGMPYLSLRGAPPAGTRTLVDGLAIPALFHVAFGPSVVPPALVDSLHVWPGAAPIDSGRHVGGLVTLQLRPPATERTLVAWDVRLIETSALVETPVAPGLSVSVSGRYGYPNWVVRALTPEVDVRYGDYQARARWAPTSQDEVLVLAMGSFDAAHEVPSDLLSSPLVFQFHRVAARFRHPPRSGRLGLSGGASAGWDESRFGSTILSSWVAGPTVEAEWWPSQDLRARAGLDAEARRFAPPTVPVGLSGDFPERDAFWSAVRERDAVAGGAFGELTLFPRPQTAVTLGARGDVNVVAGDAESWVDVRLSIRDRVARGLVLTGSAGTYHQPQSFLIELPGWTSFAVDRPAQRSLQIASGVELALPLSFGLEVQAFYSDFAHLSEYDGAGWPSSVSEVTAVDAIFPDRDGVAYGVEVLLRREIARRVSGWISYTLSRTDRDYTDKGRAPASIDRTHVLNAVVSVDLGGGFRAGARAHAHSGWPYTPQERYADMIDIGPVNSRRLPGLARLDLRLDKTWRIGPGWVGAFAEVINVGFARDAIGVHYDGCGESCPRIETTPAIVIPTLGIRGQM